MNQIGAILRGGVMPLNLFLGVLIVVHQRLPDAQIHAIISLLLWVGLACFVVTLFDLVQSMRGRLSEDLPRSAPIRSLAWFAAPVIGLYVGQQLHLAMFRRLEGSLEHVVEKIEAENITSPVSLDVLPEGEGLEEVVEEIIVHREDRATRVTFLVGSTYPAGKIGWHYSSDGERPILMLWPRSSRLNEHWFRVGR